MTDPAKPADDFRTAARIYQVVSEFVVPIVLGLLADWQFQSTPVGLMIGTLVGLAVGGLRVAQIARRLAESDRPKPPGGTP